MTTNQPTFPLDKGAGGLREKLTAPFPAEAVKHRVGRTTPDGNRGVLYLYIDARDAQNRLDDIFGVGGWNTAFSITPLPLGGGIVICRITAIVGELRVVRSDCAEFSKTEDAKSAASTAFKRAAAALGVGRYLYDVGEIRVELDNKRFRGTVELPDSMLPAEDRKGLDEIKVTYSSRPQASYQSTYRAEAAPKSNAPADPNDPMSVEITTGFFAGKRFGDIRDKHKALLWLKHNGTDQEKKAATAVYATLTEGRPNTGTAEADAEVDIPF